jgi:polysaccharide biosynthesis/export protein
MDSTFIRLLHRPLTRILLLVALFGAGPGCASTGSFVWASTLPAVPEGGGDQRLIRVGDNLSVFVRGQETPERDSIVQADGSVVVPLIGPVVVAGMTPDEAARRVEAALRPVLVEPHVAIAVTLSVPYRVTVVGEVQSAGAFELEPGEGVLAALAMAGGLTPFADDDAIYVLRQRPEAMRIRFRYKDLTQGDPQSVNFRLHDGDVVVVD